MAWDCRNDWLASLILSLHFLYPLLLALSLLKMPVYLLQLEKRSFSPSLVVQLGLPKGRPCPFIYLFFLTDPFSGSLFLLQQGWRTSEGPTQNDSPKQSIPSTMNKHPGTELRPLCLPQVSALFLGSASSINGGQLPLTLVGELETSSHKSVCSPKAILSVLSW